MPSHPDRVRKNYEVKDNYYDWYSLDWQWHVHIDYNTNRWVVHHYNKCIMNEIYKVK